MIPDSLFSPPQSPIFVLLKVLVPFSSKSLFRPVPSPVAHPPIPLSSSQSPLPSSPIPVSVLFHHLKVLSPPPRFPFPSSPLLFLRAKGNSGTTRSRPAVRVVRSKMEHCLFLSVYEGLPNNPLNNVENSKQSTT